jgi:ABC-type amino acid transport substrate-binding protein
LAKAFDEALNALMSDGTYTKVLDDYNISQGRMDKATLNGATA